MRLLIFFLLLSIFLFLSTCKPMGPLTPADAFNELQSAVAESNSERIYRLLSKKSKEKIDKVLIMFSKMDNDQLKNLSEKYGVAEKIFKDMSVKDYITLYLYIEGKKSILNTAVSQKVISIDWSGDEAVVRVSNGMELEFVREGPYWKFDMSKL